MLEIYISRDGGSANFPQVAKFEGNVLGRGKNPFFDATRKLIEMGHDPNQFVCMKWEGSNTVSMTGILGNFAKLSVSESDKHGPRFIKYKPFEVEL